VTARANLDVAVAKEDTVKVRGRVRPAAAGQKVVLQQRVGDRKKWVASGKAKVRRNGTYVLKDKPSTPGSREYRVVKPASRGIAKGVSKSLPVEVYRWEKLAYRPSAGSGFVGQGVSIGTDYYAASLATATPGDAATAEFTLGRKCTSLRATYALTDTSLTGSSATVTVSADGTTLATHPLAVGSIVADEVLDLTDVFRLKIDATTSADPAATAAVATPEVLCTR
jgi:hypothetical protein